MTDAPPVPEIAPVRGVPAPYAPGHRRLERRRRSREKALAVLVLLVAFTITIVLLALQWLGDGDRVTSASSSLPAITVQVR